MGYLIQYFGGLQPGDIIDPNITTLLTSRLGAQIGGHINPMTNWSLAQTTYQNMLSVYTPWDTSQISFCHIGDRCDFISGPFSGCYMATYIHNNIRYGVHINLGNSNGHIDQRNSWNVAVPHFQNITLCKPSSNYVDLQRDPVVSQYGGIVQYWGIISDANFCYTVALQRQNINGCVVFRFINIQNEPQAGNVIP